MAAEKKKKKKKVGKPIGDPVGTGCPNDGLWHNFIHKSHQKRGPHDMDIKHLQSEHKEDWGDLLYVAGVFTNLFTFTYRCTHISCIWGQKTCKRDFKFPRTTFWT